MKKKYAFFVASLFVLVIGHTQLPNYVPADGILGWWPFSGNANDLSGNSNNGQVYGATLTTDRFGNVDAAYLFATDVIEVPNNPLFVSDTFTLSFWQATDTPSNGNHSYIEYGSSGERLWEFGASSGTISSFGCSTLSLGSSIFTGSSWRHLAFVVVGDTVKFYWNGDLHHSFHKSLVCDSINTNRKLRFGAKLYWTSDHYDGKMDDIGFWRRALTDNEISNLFNAANNASVSKINQDDEYFTITRSPNNEIYLNISSVLRNPTVKIFNLHGQCVFQENSVSTESMKLNLGSCEHGIYFVQVASEGLEIKTKKLFID